MNRHIKNTILWMLYAPCRMLGNWLPNVVALPTLAQAHDILRQSGYKMDEGKFTPPP